jgi:DNA-binding IclR family transcriptional regulator
MSDSLAGSITETESLSDPTDITQPFGTGPVERAFHLLRTVADAHQALGVRELGRRSGLPRSTASRLANQLTDLGMLTRNTDGLLSIGPAVASLLPDGPTPRLAIEDLLRPLLVELVERFGESAALTIDTSAGAHYLAQVASPSAVQVPDATGSSIDFHLVAPGLALMAGWPDERLATYLSQPLTVATEFTITQPAAIRQRLTAAQHAGFVWTNQELDREVNGLAVTIPAGGGRVAAISLYGPAYRLNPDEQPTLGSTLVELVNQRASRLLP